LDHILVNEAAFDAISETGWIEEENPFIPSDHGIVWIALDRSKLKGIRIIARERNNNERHVTTTLG
jgi:hypothetical protein